MSHRTKVFAAAVVACVSGVAVLRLSAADEKNAAPSRSGAERFFEMRTYTAPEGRLADLDARFREHTNALFRKHGMDLVGYWHPVDKKDVLVYILAYPSREAREKSWKEFSADPEWKAVVKESEANGKIVAKVESVFMTPTDYSPIR